MARKEKIGVVGAGLMGREIALVFALAGHDVLMADRSEESLVQALNRLRSILDKGLERGVFRPGEADEALSKITTTLALSSFADREFVTEAVFEREDVKADVYRELDAVCQPDCIFATNTSTVPISVLAASVG
jgi:3-hydroxybutyryl-CoA dehydrogenase